MLGVVTALTPIIQTYGESWMKKVAPAMPAAMSVDEVVAFVKENVARVQAERDAAIRTGGTPPVDAPPVDAPPVDAPPVDALAASAYLTAEEKATVMWLVPRFPAARLEELKAKLLQMEPRDAAMWIREHLAALRAEASS